MSKQNSKKKTVIAIGMKILEKAIDAFKFYVGVKAVTVLGCVIIPYIGCIIL